VQYQAIAARLFGRPVAVVGAPWGDGLLDRARVRTGQQAKTGSRPSGPRGALRVAPGRPATVGPARPGVHVVGRRCEGFPARRAVDP